MRGLYFGNPLCALNNDNPPSSSLPSDINFLSNASLTICKAGRSFTEPPGFRNSHLP